MRAPTGSLLSYDDEQLREPPLFLLHTKAVVEASLEAQVPPARSSDTLVWGTEDETTVKMGEIPLKLGALHQGLSLCTCLLQVLERM